MVIESGSTWATVWEECVVVGAGVFPDKKEVSLFNQLLNTDWRVVERPPVSVMVLLTGYGSWSRGGGRVGSSLSLFSTSDCTKGSISVPDPSAPKDDSGMRLLLWNILEILDLCVVSAGSYRNASSAALWTNSSW